MAKYRKAHDHGVLDYLKDAASWIAEMRGNRSSSNEKETNAAPEPTGAPLSVRQYYQSQDLLRKMKWKRVTWDQDADFEAFSRRLMENDAIFKSVPAFSHMNLHLTRDMNAVKGNAGGDSINSSRSLIDMKAGCLSDWYLAERQSIIAPFRCDSSNSLQAERLVQQDTFTKTINRRQPPFTVDWEVGEARLLDTASPREILTFLETCAPRVQALQVRMEAEQTKITEELDKLKNRLGVLDVHINSHDKTFWDDKARLNSSGGNRRFNPEYVTPAHVLQFVEAANKRAVFLRRNGFRWNAVRILSPNSPHNIDYTKREIQIPCNFEEFLYLPIHRRYRLVEALARFWRKYVMLWFFFVMIIIGDFELL